jgi:putative transposase
VSTLSLNERRTRIDWENRSLSIQEQACLLQLNRTGLYYIRQALSEEELALRKWIDRLNTDYPCYGSRRLAVLLKNAGFVISRKKVQRLMAAMGLLAIYPHKRSLSQSDPAHKKYPYLLKGVKALYPNHIWGTDITYVRLKGGWMYLTVILDWYSRYVVSWSLSDQMTTDFVIELLNQAFARGRPAILNSDQGSQYTSSAYLDRIREESDTIGISMDGRGRCMDNIFTERFWRTYKYEEVYLKDYDSPRECRRCTAEYLDHYNNRRPHQALSYKTPYEVYVKQS